MLCLGCAPKAEPRPNVILITMDTVRADYVSCYGQPGGTAGNLPGGTTPFLDRLAADGVQFRDAHSASAVTPVSHATILSGRFPPSHGLRVLSGDGGARLDDSIPTLATRFRDEGYSTLAVHSAFPVSSIFGFAEGFDVFESLEGKLAMNSERGKTTWDTQQFQRRSDATTARVLDLLEGQSEPWFLWVHYWDPHDPILKPPMEALEGMPSTEGVVGPISRGYADFYAREIAFQDQQIGQLLEAAGAFSGSDRPLVAVTADHGEGLADGQERHGWSKHRMTYREQLWVPFLLSGPGVPAGKVVDAQVRTADLAPTLLDFAGLSPDADVDGVSLRPWIDGERSDPLMVYADQVNYYDFNAGMVAQRPDSAFLYTASDGRWKLIYRPHMVAQSELFDLASDPHEERNVANEHPEEFRRLLQELGSRRPWITRPFEPPGDRGSALALTALGYAAGGSDRELEWTWFCPVHPDATGDRPGRCANADCDVQCVPRTNWSD